MHITIPEWMIYWVVLILITAGLGLASGIVAYAFLLWSKRAANKVLATYEMYVIRFWMLKLRDRGWSIPTKKRLDTLDSEREERKQEEPHDNP